MRAIILVAVLSLLVPFVFAKSFGSNVLYQVQSVQEPVQHDNIVLTRLPLWNNASNDVTGKITVSTMWGSPMRIANTTQGFAGPCTVAGNRTSCVTKALRRGSSFPIGYPGLYVRDTAVGRTKQCTRGASKCVNNTYEKCIGGFWVSTEKCRKSETCTLQGCRIIRTQRYFPVTIRPIPIGKTIGAAN